LIRVRVLAASPVIRAGLEALLSRAGDIELHQRPAADLDTAADVIIADRASILGAESGVARLASAERSSPVVLLLDDVVHDWPEAFRAGARAVLPPDANGDEILAAVRAAAAGLIALPAEIAESIVERAPRPRVSTGFAEPLSPREREILAMLAEGLANKTIATRLGISRHTVKAHVSSILTKLDAGTRAEAIVIGARLGMVVL